jgi:hypothetical protein
MNAKVIYSYIKIIVLEGSTTGIPINIFQNLSNIVNINYIIVNY